MRYARAREATARPLLRDTLTPHQRAGSNRLILNDSRRDVVAV